MANESGDTVELRHLRYFVAIAEELNFDRAARRLRMSQPPLSQQMRDLEREIGVTLLDRSQRSIRLTQAGRMFLEEAKRTLEQVERSVQTAVRADRGEIGRLSIGFLGSATYDVLPRMLRAFRKRCPEVQLQLQTMSTSQQLQAFKEENIDVGILRMPVDDGSQLFTSASLQTKVVANEPLVAALSTEHRLAKTEAVRLRDLAEEDFILWPRSQGVHTHDRIIGLCQNAGFSPSIVQESAELQTTLGLVATGIGASLLIGTPEHMLRHPSVVYRAVEDAEVVFQLALAWKIEGDSPVVQAFINSLGLGPFQ